MLDGLCNDDGRIELQISGVCFTGHVPANSQLLALVQKTETAVDTMTISIHLLSEADLDLYDALNSKAIAMYETLKFIEVGRVTDRFRNGNEVIDDIHMVTAVHTPAGV
jgi:hypothetical protein